MISLIPIIFNMFSILFWILIISLEQFNYGTPYFPLFCYSWPFDWRISSILFLVSIFFVKMSKEDAAIFWNLIIPNVFPNSFFFRYPNQTLSRISSNLIVPDIPPIFLVFRNFCAVGGNAKKSFIFIDDCFAWRFFQKQFRSSMNERPGCPAIKWKSQNTGPGNPIYETVTPATVESSLKNHHRIKSSCLSTM